MKRILSILCIAAVLAMALPASATSYPGYVRNWWVETNGNLTFYLLDPASQSSFVPGLCGGNYTLKADQMNYDAALLSLVGAAWHGTKVLLEVSTCNGNANILDMVKVCTWTGDC
jgi:hypothetical protein